METTQTLYNFVQAYFDLDNNNNNNNTSNTNNNNSHPPTSSKQMETSNNNNNHNNNQHQQYKEDSLMEEALQMPFFKKALQIMENVPHYHAHTLELIASSRSSTLTCKFLLALTSGVPQSTNSAPLEIKAHDPVAYVGEMLTFCFQSLLLECDLLHGLHNNNNNNNDTNNIDRQQQLLLTSSHNNNTTNTM